MYYSTILKVEILIDQCISDGIRLILVVIPQSVKWKAQSCTTRHISFLSAPTLPWNVIPKHLSSILFSLGLQQNRRRQSVVITRCFTNLERKNVWLNAEVKLIIYVPPLILYKKKDISLEASQRIQFSTIKNSLAWRDIYLGIIDEVLAQSLGSRDEPLDGMETRW